MGKKQIAALRAVADKFPTFELLFAGVAIDAKLAIDKSTETRQGE